MNPTLTPPDELRLDAVVEQYESARVNDPSTRIEDFLLPRSDPAYARAAVELMRVELEHQWQAGQPKPLQDYVRQFQDVLSDATHRGQLAFEEYRLRLQGGEPVTPQEYARQFSIETNHWPTSTRARQGEAGGWAIADWDPEGKRLVQAIQPFPVAGTTCAGFQLVRQIGQGTFGRVFLARQPSLAGRWVVVKITAGATPEPERLARLQHTYIVPVYSVHQHEALHVLCMPFYGLTTLADILRHLRSRPQRPVSADLFAEVIARQQAVAASWSDAASSVDRAKAGSAALLSEGQDYVTTCLTLACKMAEALAYAYRRGILHRDLKPANVLLTDDGQPMLLDFNLSDDLVAGGPSNLLVGGTLPYMAPEHLQAYQQGGTVDHRSDIYSFGVLLYELLTGRHPFAASPISKGSTLIAADPQAAIPQPQVSAAVQVETLIAQRLQGVPDIRRDNPDVSPATAAIVARCLQPEVEQRYDSIEQVHEDLQRQLQNLPLRYAADRSWTERVGKWCRRHPRLVSGTSITAAAALLIAGLLLVLGVRSHTISRLQAAARLEALEREMPQLRVQLSWPDTRFPAFETGMQRARTWLPQILPGSPPAEDHYAALAADQQVTWQTTANQLLYLLAGAEIRRAQQQPQNAAQYLAEARRLHAAARSLQSPAAGSALQLQDDHLWQVTPAAERGPAGEKAEHAVADERPAAAPDLASLEKSADPEDAFLLALGLLEQGHYPEATERLERISRVRPLDFSVWFLLGNALVGSQRLSEAEDCFATCIALWPESPLPYFQRGLCRLDLRQYAAAESDFSSALQRAPDLVAAYVNRALAHSGQQQLQQAVADLDRALQLDANQPRIYLLRARLRKRLNDEAGANRDRQRGLDLAARDLEDWLAQGLAWLPEDPSAALAAFRQAARRYPHQRGPLRNIAFVQAEHLHEYDQALATLNQLIARWDHPEDRISRAVIHARLQHRERALADAEQALKQQADAKMWFQAGCVYALTSRQQSTDAGRAVALISKAITQDERWLQFAWRDTDLSALRSNRQFQAMLAAAGTLRQLATPHESLPRKPAQSTDSVSSGSTAMPR